jgi:hypothetical protein
MVVIDSSVTVCGRSLSFFLLQSNWPQLVVNSGGGR